MSQAKTTTDHAAIHKWAESRRGWPARVESAEKGDDPGILRLGFGEPAGKLAEISRDEFFEKFEKDELAFLFQDEFDSRFDKLVRRK